MATTATGHDHRLVKQFMRRSSRNARPGSCSPSRHRATQQIQRKFPLARDTLTDLVLDPPGGTQDLAGTPLREEDFLILSTIHSAKGCEWDRVYVIHAADGNIPLRYGHWSDEEIEEERRLFYVARSRGRRLPGNDFPSTRMRSGPTHPNVIMQSAALGMSSCAEFPTPESRSAGDATSVVPRRLIRHPGQPSGQPWT